VINLCIPSVPFGNEEMPSRKPHSKSRRGCIECKRRHTKVWSHQSLEFKFLTVFFQCDEQYPRCSTCSRLEIHCTWPNWKPRNESTLSPNPVDVSTPGLITSFNNISKSLRDHSEISEDLAIDDLKLLHHFTTKTYATLDSVVSQQDIWRESVIQIGFQHPFLLRGILGISALHLATLNPDLSVNFAIQASNQYNRALLDFRNVLHNVGEENCVAVFAFSCITVVHAFAVAQVHQPQDPISDFLNCMRLVQGVVTVLKPHYSALWISELSPILGNGLKGGIQGEISEILQLKALIKSLPDDDRDDIADAYLHAIDLLHTVLLESQKAGENQSYLALLFSWPALLSPKFLSSLSIQEPVSLIIMAHFAGILGHKSFWWITCWNTCIVNAVEPRLSPDLVEWLVWPRQMCGDKAG